jgi:ketosteroid isomerase-like protein
MIHYTTEPFAVDDDRVVMLGRTSWRNRHTGRHFDTPKVDLATFRDGRVVEFLEFYDTAMVLAAQG